MSVIYIFCLIVINSILCEHLNLRDIGNISKISIDSKSKQQSLLVNLKSQSLQRQRRSSLKVVNFHGEDSYFKSSSLKKRTVTFENSQLDIDANLLKRFKNTWPVKKWITNGVFSEDYILLINKHWLQFSPPANEVQFGLAALYICLMLAGCFGNGIVLVLYLRCRSLRTPGNVLVANLALSDFLMLAKTPIFIFNSFNLGPALGKPGCIIYGLIGGLTGTTSIATLAAIALDRYWAVVRPLEPLRSLTAIRARFMAVAAWIYAAIFSSIPALDIGYGRYVPEGYLTSCSFDYLTDELPPRYFIFVFFCAAWLVPFSTIFFCYLKILFVVIFHRNVSVRNQEHRLSSRHIKEQAKRKSEVKLAILVIIVIALFFVSWTPYAIVALIGIFGRKDLITPTASMAPALFCKTAACINPFIYIISHPNFRKELNKLCKSKKLEHFRGVKETYYMEVNKIHRSSSRNLDCTDVEEIEMKDIPYATQHNTNEVIRTVAATVSERDNFSQCFKADSIEENAISPPSWFVKPKFSKKYSIKKITL